MKKLILAGVLLLLVSTLGFAQMDDEIPMVGVIVDCASMGAHKDDLADFLDTYTKEAALSPDAVKSGYGIFLEDSFMIFDDVSNAKIVDFLKKEDSTIQVSVSVFIKEGNILNLVSIANK